MPRPVSFIFHDGRKKRWRKIKKFFLTGLTIIVTITIIFILSGLTVPKFDISLTYPLEVSKKEIIDKLSTKKEDVIEVVGSGTFVSIHHLNKDLLLQRFNPKLSNDKIAVFTFDDGPDPTYTPQILEILKKENIKAIFFVVGEYSLVNKHLLTKIVEDGHILGNHTFTHIPENTDLYSDSKRTSFELDFSQKVIEGITGYKTRVFRIPYWGAEDTISLNTLILSVWGLERGYLVMPPTVDSKDWQETNHLKVTQNSIGDLPINVVLLHDGGSDRSVTVKALPEIIRMYKEKGYSFENPEVLFKSFGGSMHKVSLIEKITSLLSIYYYLSAKKFFKFLNPIYKVTLAILSGSILTVIVLSSLHAIFRKNRSNPDYRPKLSILIPAYNEEKTIVSTIKSLLNSSYQRLEIIVINNNSTDETAQVVKPLLNGTVKLVQERKQGKYHALNRGIKKAKGEILVAVDADTQIVPETLENIIKPFTNPKIGAVAGNLKVGNISNLLTAFQAVEYLSGINLDRRAYDFIGAQIVVPGALGAWRKKAVMRVGGYKGNTLTEDADLTVKIQKLGYKVFFASNAIAYTEAPENLKSFFKQRFRWTFGMLQVLYKNRDMFFKPKYGTLGILILPYLGIIQFSFMLLSPLIDLLTIIYLIFISIHPVVEYLAFFLITQIVLTSYAFYLAKEKNIWLLAILPLQRIIYQGLWYYILYKSTLTILQGKLIPWNKLTHYGKVDIGLRISPLHAPSLVPESIET